MSETSMMQRHDVDVPYVGKPVLVNCFVKKNRLLESSFH